MRAAVYTRLSRKTDKNVPNIDDQLAWARGAAADNGWTVTHEFRDLAESAFDRDGDDRPAFAELGALVRDGSIDAVIASAPDRLWRDDVTRALFLKDCAKNGIVIVTKMGTMDASAPGDKMLATITGAIGEYESAVKRARSLAKAEQRARAGLPGGGGHRPFGYEDDRVTPKADEAKVVRDLIARVLAGESFRSLLLSLNEGGITTTSGGKWQPVPLKRLLTSPRIAGLRRHRGVEFEATWPALVDRDDWRAAVAILTTERPRREPRSYPLTGVLTCGRCGTRLHARPRDDGARCYVCPNPRVREGACGRMKVLAEPLEEFIREQIVDRADTPELSAAVAAAERDTDRPGRVADLDQLRNRAAELGESFAAGRLSIDAFEVADRALRAQIDELTREIEAIPAPASARLVGRGGELAKAWPSMTVPEQHQVVAALVETVEIAPAVRGRNRFDEDRVSVNWRF